MQRRASQRLGVNVRRRSTVMLVSNYGAQQSHPLKELDLQAIPVVGRDREREMLRRAMRQAQAYDEAMVEEDSNKTQVAFVAGASGTGKSTLIESALQMHVQDGGQVLYCLGKFDQTRSNRPWKGLIDAFDDLYRKIASSTKRNDICTKLLANFEQNDLSFLASLVPSLQSLLQIAPAQRSETFLAKHALSVLRNLLHKLLAITCSLCPVAMVVDDLQWADESSLEIVTSIAGQKRIQDLLLVLVYRDEELPSDHALLTFQRTFPPEVCVRVNPLLVADVAAMVAHLTQSSPSRVEGLAAIIHKKTNGNVFFAIRLLQKMEEDRLLFFSHLTYQWEWDEEEIAASTDVADNVVDMLVHKIQTISSVAQLALKIGSCVGSQFDSDILLYVMQNGFVDESDGTALITPRAMISQALQEAVDENLLQHSPGSKFYKFAHDRIQQAVNVLHSESAERQQLHELIGQYLLGRYRSSSSDQCDLLVAVDLINCGKAREKSSNDGLELARLNLEAAQVAAGFSAFDASSKYLGTARLLLGRGWKLNYKLMLEMSTLLMEHSWAAGDEAQCRLLIEEILAQSTSLEDKIPCYHQLILCDVAQGKLFETVNFCRIVLRRLDVPMPQGTRKSHLWLEYTRARHAVAKIGIGTGLLSIERCVDWRTNAAMLMLSKMVNIAFATGDYVLMLYGSARMMRMTVQRGICKLSPIAFTMYGVVVAALSGDLGNGFELGELAVRLADRLGVKSVKGHAMGNGCFFLHHLRRPLHSTLARSLEAHHLCVEDGDVDYACMCLMTYCWSYVWCGLPLRPLVKDSLTMLSSFADYNQELLRRHRGVGHRFSQVMTGLVPRQDAFGPFKNGVYIKARKIAIWLESIVAVYFDDLATLHANEQVYWRYWKSLLDPSFESTVRTFYIGVAECMLYEWKRKRVYLKRARKVMRRLQLWVARGNMNCCHMQLFLDAELLRVRSRPSLRDKVEGAYRDAIVSISRSGFVQHAALAHERLATYLLGQNDKLEASYYMTRAQELYVEWNADAKAADLELRHAALLKANHFGSAMSSTGLLGRSRIQPSAKYKGQLGKRFAVDKKSHEPVTEHLSESNRESTELGSSL